MNNDHLVFRRLDPTEIGDFEASLADTIAWCAPRISRADPRGCLRTVQLFPRFDDLCRNEETTRIPEWTRDPAHNKAVIDRLLRARRDRLSDTPRPLVGDKKGGKLLAYYYYEGTAEGASKIASMGYLDEVDSPPWDTYVWYRQDLSLGFPEGNALVCWVPAEFIELVDAGILAQSAPVMRWIDEYK